MSSKKYAFGNGIINAVTGRNVPSDVPVFILLGTDARAAGAIEAYASTCVNNDHRQACLSEARRFREWQQANPDRVHEPDTFSWEKEETDGK